MAAPVSHISYSELKTYKVCPKAYQFKYRDLVPDLPERAKRAYVGSVIGALVDQFYKRRLWRLRDDAADAMEALIPAVSAEVLKKHPVSFMPEEQTIYDARVAVMIPGVIRTIKTEKLLGERNLTEHELEVPVDGHIVHGRADVIVERQQVLTVLDLKAGATKGRFADVDQLRLYALGIQRALGRLPERAGFWWCKHDTIVWKPLKPAALDTFQAAVRERLGRIAAGDYRPTPGTACQRCDYRHVCPEGQAHVLLARKEARVPLDGSGGEISL